MLLLVAFSSSVLSASEEDDYPITSINQFLQEIYYDPRSRKTQRLGSDDRYHCSIRFLCNHRTTYPRYLVNDVLILAASMIGGFIVAALLTDGNADDDDDHGGGMMIPATNPI